MREIVTAHKMDADLRELYVEGTRDQAFLIALAGTTKHQDSVVVPIDAVEVSDVADGGHRERLFKFARYVENETDAIRYFADRDYGPDPATLPANGWITDGHDLESYFLRTDCFAKLAVPAAQFRSAGATAALLNSVKLAARDVGILRILSLRNNLQLPFSKVDLRRSTRLHKGSLSVDLAKYVRSLLQNAELSLKELSNVLESHSRLSDELSDLADTHAIHGKDVLNLLAVALRKGWVACRHNLGDVR